MSIIFKLKYHINTNIIRIQKFLQKVHWVYTHNDQLIRLAKIDTFNQKENKKKKIIYVHVDVWYVIDT